MDSTVEKLTDSWIEWQGGECPARDEAASKDMKDE